jgi:hypothetical protein
MGRPFTGSVYRKGPQEVPGVIELVYYDLGGEGIAMIIHLQKMKALN